MQKQKLIIAALLLAVALFPSDASAWCNSSYSSRVPVNINTTTNLTNYQIPFNLTYDADMNANFSDLLYCDINDIQRPFFIESNVSSSWAKLWLNASVNVTNGTQGYIYFGNPIATSQSNISQTMLFGDDVTSDRSSHFYKNGTTWTYNSTGGNYKINGTNNCPSGACFLPIYDTGNISQNYTTYAEMSAVIGSNTQFGFIFNAQNNASTTNTYLSRYGNALGDLAQIYNWNPNAQVGSNSGVMKTTNQIYKMNLTIKTTGSIEFWVWNTTQSISVITSDTTRTTGWAGLYIFFAETSSYLNLFKIYIRKKANIEPAVSIGAKETNGAPTITSPTSSTYYITNLTLNFTVSNVNATYPCWKTQDGVITSLGNVSNNTANASTITLNNSAHTVSVTCFGGSPSANATTTVTPTIIYSEIRAKNAVGGAAINTFTANFSNGTSSSILFTTNGLIQTPLDALPQGAINLTVTADGFGMNNTINYTINSTNFFNTSVNMNAASVTIYVYNEKSPSTLLSSNITFANSTLTKTWYNVNNISQLYSNLTLGDTTITISSAGYETRNYYMTITSQTLVNMSAYLLATASGQTVRFHVVDTSEAAIASVLTTAQLSVNNVYVTAEQAYTDTSGTATLFLDPTTTYQMVFTHPSYTTLITTIQPSQQDYKVYLSGSAVINITYIYGNLQVLISPQSTSLVRHSPGVQWFNYTIIAPDGDLTAWGWTIQDNSLNILYNNAITTSPFGGTDTYLLNFTNLTYWIYVDTFFTRNGNTTWNHMIFNLNNVTRMNNTLSDIFDTFKSGKNITSNLNNVTNTLEIPKNYGYKKETLMLLGIIITIMVMSFASSQFISNSGGVGIVGLLCVVFLGFVGILPWGMVSMLAVGIIGLLFLRGVV